VDVDIVLAHPQVSRQHARIVCEKALEYTLVDLQSSHGTYVNGERIDRHALRSRDCIRLGPQGLELTFLVGGPDPDTASDADRTTMVSGLLAGAGIERSVKRLASVLPEESDAHSELEKISCLLDFHYYFGKTFSAERTFQHILKSALGISGAERGFILRKEHGEFVYAVGLDSSGKPLGQTDFRTSGSVVERVVASIAMRRRSWGFCISTARSRCRRSRGWMRSCWFV